MMTLPRPIVAYQKRASDHPDPFGPWCKLHHAFLIHLTDARLSGAAYKVVIQVLCASFHFGQYHPASLSLEQFQRGQHLGRKAVIEGLRQAVAKGILYEERGWQTGAHAPKQYGLVFYRALAAGRSDESQGPQRITWLKGGAFPPAQPAQASRTAWSEVSGRKGRSSSAPHPGTDEVVKAMTGSESEPVDDDHPGLSEEVGSESELAPVLQPHQHQCGKRISSRALSALEQTQQRRRETGSGAAQEQEERQEYTRIPATLAPPHGAAPERQSHLEEEPAASFPQRPLSAGVAASLHLLPSEQQVNAPEDGADPAAGEDGRMAERNTRQAELAALRVECEHRQAALAAWHPRGVDQIQAKITARLEVRRLERQIEELVAALASQDQRTQDVEGICAVGQPDEASVSAAQRTNASEHPSSGPLQVPEEQLALWRADVAAQRREVTRLRTQYQDVAEQLQHCHVGKGNWGALMREQRFLARELAEQEAQLTRYERFVALIEHGATKDEVCEQLLGLHTQATAAEDCVAEEPTPAVAILEDRASEISAEPAPRLEGQKLRQALFTALAQMFTNGDPRLIELERGRFNRAIKNLVAVDVQPEDLPVLQATFQRLWPKATCTALGLANNLTILLSTTQHRI
jgi:hypothetical protein